MSLNSSSSVAREDHKFEFSDVYSRRLIHNIADHFNLGHQTDQDKRSVLVFMKRTFNKPKLSFCDPFELFEASQYQSKCTIIEAKEFENNQHGMMFKFCCF